MHKIMRQENRFLVDRQERQYFKLNKLARALDCGLRSELEIHRYVSLFRDSLGNADFLCPLRKY